MKWFWKRSRSTVDHEAAQRSVEDTEEQLRAIAQNWPQVHQDSNWARRAQQTNGFTELFLTTIRGGHNS